MRITKDVSLSKHTTFCLGGPASFLIEVVTPVELKEAYAFASTKNLPVFILGGGSNTLVSDDGFRGVVIKIDITGIEAVSKNGAYVLRAGAGVVWDELVSSMVEKGLWGLENLSGIPGTVGGAVVQNIGAYGSAVSEILEEVEIFNTKKGIVETLSVGDCAFDYRSSIFKTDGGERVVLSASFRLSQEPKPNLSYVDLSERFGEIEPSLLEVRQAVLDIRRAKFPDLAKEGTAGSFFKNPILSKEEAIILKTKYPNIPLFDMPETDGVKIPLGWILDKVLGLRGLVMGKTRLFEKQALVIVAEHGARAEEVLALEEEVKRRVQEECGFELSREIVFLK